MQDMPSRGHRELVDDAAIRARSALDLVAGVLGLSNADVARVIGRSVSAAQERRRGATRLQIGDAQRLAEAYDFPVSLFTADEPTILRWFADHPDRLRGRGSNSQPTEASRCARRAALPPRFRANCYQRRTVRFLARPDPRKTRETWPLYN